MVGVVVGVMGVVISGEVLGGHARQGRTQSAKHAKGELSMQ